MRKTAKDSTREEYRRACPYWWVKAHIQLDDCMCHVYHEICTPLLSLCPHMVKWDKIHKTE